MNKILRWTGRVAGGLLALLLLAAAGVYGVTEARMRRHYEVPPSSAPRVNVTPALLAEEQRLAVTRGCTECHGDNMGGKAVIDQFPIARVSGKNLTRGRGGVGARYTDADFVRAIRHGVNAEGRGLLVMPSDEFNTVSDAEVGAIVACLGSIPPVDNEARANAVWPLGPGAVRGRGDSAGGRGAHRAHRGARAPAGAGGHGGIRASPGPRLHGVARQDAGGRQDRAVDVGRWMTNDRRRGMIPRRPFFATNTTRAAPNLSS